MKKSWLLAGILFYLVSIIAFAELACNKRIKNYEFKQNEMLAKLTNEGNSTILIGDFFISPVGHIYQSNVCEYSKNNPIFFIRHTSKTWQHDKYLQKDRKQNEIN